MGNHTQVITVLRGYFLKIFFPLGVIFQSLMARIFWELLKVWSEHSAPPGAHKPCWKSASSALGWAQRAACDGRGPNWPNYPDLESEVGK